MNSNIIFHIIGDVSGDGIPDKVFMTGISSFSSGFIQDINLLICDGRTGLTTKIQLNENAGYNPRVFLGDFNGDGVKDILVSIDSGGSGAVMYHYLYSYIDNIPQLIFDFNLYNEEYKYNITYKDNFIVEVLSKINNKKYLLDISLRDEAYLKELYDKNGKLKEPIEGFVNPLSGLYPVDFDSNGVFELLAYQKIAGIYNADSLGYFLNTLMWENSRFQLYNQNVAI